MMPELPKKRSLRQIETYFEIRFSRLSSQGEAGGVGGEVLGWDEDGGGVWRIWSAPGAYAKGYRRVIYRACVSVVTGFPLMIRHK
jgi:hypothetical protein